MLKIHLLGKTSFQVSSASHAIFRKSLRLRILGFLIITGEPVSRKRLSRIFWPHLSDQDARTYLRNILARLKEDFSPWILITRDSISFDLNSDCWIDSLELSRILKQYNESDFLRLEYAAVNEFKSGLELYKGDYMADLTRSVSPWFDDWLMAEREDLLNQVLRGYEKLVSFRIDKKDWDSAIEEAETMLKLSHMYEPAWLLLMQSLAKSGDLRRAQETFERFERMKPHDDVDSRTHKEMMLLYRRIGQKISGINLNLDTLNVPDIDNERGARFD